MRIVRCSRAHVCGRGILPFSRPPTWFQVGRKQVFARRIAVKALEVGRNSRPFTGVTLMIGGPVRIRVLLTICAIAEWRRRISPILTTVRTV